VRELIRGSAGREPKRRKHIGDARLAPDDVEEALAAALRAAADRAGMVLGWRDVVEGIFEVRGRDGAAYVMENLIDDLTYRVRSNTGTGVFRQIPRRSVVITRLVPIGDEWLISGATNVFPARYRAELYRAAAEQAIRSPELGFRNPDMLARAWELQRADRKRFVRLFGADLIVLRGRRSRIGCARSGSSATRRSRRAGRAWLAISSRRWGLTRSWPTPSRWP